MRRTVLWNAFHAQELARELSKTEHLGIVLTETVSQCFHIVSPRRFSILSI
jgi:hypothetical protein